MRKLLALAFVVLLLLVADQAARVVAEAKLATRAREAARSPDSADATITSFPFLGRLLLSGSVPRVKVRVTGAEAGPLRLAVVEVEGTGVALDRSALLSGGIRLQGIETGVVAVELDGAALTEALHVPVSVAGGKVLVGAGPAAVEAGVEVNRAGTLTLRLAGLPALTVPVVRTPLIPCAVTVVSVRGDRARLSCQVDELPAVLRR